MTQPPPDRDGSRGHEGAPAERRAAGDDREPWRPRRRSLVPRAGGGSGRVATDPRQEGGWQHGSTATEAAATGVIDVAAALRHGWAYLRGDPAAAIAAAALLLIPSVVAMLALWRFGIVGSVAGAAVPYILLGGYAQHVLRRLRGEPAEVATVLSGVHRALPLALAGVIISVFTSVGLMLFVVPGLIVQGLYLFVPFLIMDRGLDFWAAMEASRRATMAQPGPSLLLLAVVLGLNFLGAVFLIFGMLLTVPIAYGALAAAYESCFGRLDPAARMC
jgi:hypothetical protein